MHTYTHKNDWESFGLIIIKHQYRNYMPAHHHDSLSPCGTSYPTPLSLSYEDPTPSLDASLLYQHPKLSLQWVFHFSQSCQRNLLLSLILLTPNRNLLRTVILIICNSKLGLLFSSSALTTGSSSPWLYTNLFEKFVACTKSYNEFSKINK